MREHERAPREEDDVADPDRRVEARLLHVLLVVRAARVVREPAPGASASAVEHAHARAAEPFAVRDTAEVPVPAGPGDPACGAALLTVAVLLGLARRRAPLLVAPAPAPSAPARSAPAERGPPRLLLTRICVLRT